MKINIESVEYSEDMINYLVNHNLKLEFISLSCNRHLDLVISGEYDNLRKLLFDWHYLTSDQSNEEIEDEIKMYFIKEPSISAYLFVHQ